MPARPLQRPSRVPSPVRPSRRGATLIEVLIAGTVLVLGAGAVMSVFASVQSMERSQQSRSLAVEAARSRLERLKGEEFREVFARYNAATDDDPPGIAPSPGSGFAVAGLAAVEGDLDGLPGEILFPVVGSELREDVQDPGRGLPRDLDLDGEVDDADHASDYVVLPVVVLVRWAGVDGEHEFRLDYLLSEL